MGIKCSASPSAFKALVDDAIRIVRDEIFNALAYLGEQSVTRIKDRSAEESWIDQTGNLRSSIGYAVYDHGRKLVESAFDQVLNGSQGTSEGKKYVNELASKFANVYALVVVAGMSYADYVEKLENKDVLASTELWAKTKVNEYMMKAQKKAESKINRMFAR